MIVETVDELAGIKALRVGAAPDHTAGREKLRVCATPELCHCKLSVPCPLGSIGSNGSQAKAPVGRGSTWVSEQDGALKPGKNTMLAGLQKKTGVPILSIQQENQFDGLDFFRGI